MGLVPQELQIDGEARSGTPRAAGACLVVAGQQWIVERPSLGGNDRLPSPNRNASLELVERHADSGLVQPVECPLDPAIADQPGEPLVVDSCVSQQGQVRARGVLVDPAADELEKRALPIPQRVLERRSRSLGAWSGFAEESRKASQHPRPHQGFVDDRSRDLHGC